MEQADKNLFITYREQQIGKTIYRMADVYKGEIELKKALQTLIVRKILQEGNANG